MCAKWFIDVEGNFSVIDFFRHRFSFAPTSAVRRRYPVASTALFGGLSVDPDFRLSKVDVVVPYDSVAVGIGMSASKDGIVL